MFAYFEWMGELVKIVGDLIPRRILVEPTHMGMKFKGMKKNVVLKPGRYWYLPFFSTVYVIPVKRQSLYLAEQDLTTKDGKPIKVRATVAYEVSDIETAMVNCYEFGNQIDDETMGLIALYVTRRSFSFLQGKRKMVNAEISRMVNNRMAEYGVSIKRVQIVSLSTGIPLLHIGHTDEASEI